MGLIARVRALTMGPHRGATRDREAIVNAEAGASYLLWWRRIGAWIAIWFLLALILSTIQIGADEAFESFSTVVTIGLVSFIYAAVTSPLLVAGLGFVSLSRDIGHEIDSLRVSIE